MSRTLSPMGKGQRIVLIIGWGLALGFVGLWATAPPGPTGWVAYAPLAGEFQSVRYSGALEPWQQLLIWLALVVGWTAVAFFVLRPSQRARNRASEVNQR